MSSQTALLTDSDTTLEILELIGVGGFGAVYRAHLFQGDARTEVAA